MFDSLKEFLQNKKTYFVAVGAIVTACIGYADDLLSTVEFVQAVIVALLAITMRAAIAKV